MKSYFNYDTVDVLLYNKYYNPKIKNNYLYRNMLNETEYDNDKDNIFKSNYDIYDYDFLDNLD